jgi:hypothetical protein
MTVYIEFERAKDFTKKPEQLMIFLEKEAAKDASQLLEVKQGRTLIYGRLKTGELRSNFKSIDLPSLLEGLVTPAGKTSDRTLNNAIEIKFGGETWFKQDRSGKVSINRFSLELEKVPEKITYRDLFSAEYDPPKEYALPSDEKAASRLTLAKQLTEEIESFSKKRLTDEEARQYIISHLQEAYYYKTESHTALGQYLQETFNLTSLDTNKIAYDRDRNYIVVETNDEQSYVFENLSLEIWEEIQKRDPQHRHDQAENLWSFNQIPHTAVQIPQARLAGTQRLLGIAQDLLQVRDENFSQTIEFENFQILSNPSEIAFVEGDRLLAYGKRQQDGSVVAISPDRIEIQSSPLLLEASQQRASLKVDFAYPSRLFKKATSLASLDSERDLLQTSERVIEFTSNKANFEPERSVESEKKNDPLWQFEASPQTASSSSSALEEIKAHLERWETPVAQKKYMERFFTLAPKQYQQLDNGVKKLAKSLQLAWKPNLDLDRQFKTVVASIDRQKEFLSDRVSEKIVELGNWIANRPEAIATYRTMESAYEKFQKGFHQTAESSYQIDAYKIERLDRSTYRLEDTNQKSLIEFEVVGEAEGAIRFKLKEKAPERSMRSVLKTIQNPEINPQPSPIKRAVRENLIQAIEQRLERLENGSQIGAYLVERDEEKITLKDSKNRSINLLSSSYYQLEQLDWNLRSSEYQQQAQRVAPIWARHLFECNCTQIESEQSSLLFDAQTKRLIYDDKVAHKNFIVERVGDGWQYVSGELSLEREKYLLEVVRPKQQEYIDRNTNENNSARTKFQHSISL